MLVIDQHGGRMLEQAVRHLLQHQPHVLEADLLADDVERHRGKAVCIARMVRDSTVPSPMPASNSRSAGGRGWMLASSMRNRWATTHFSLQVVTNSRYFCRLS